MLRQHAPLPLESSKIILEWLTPPSQAEDFFFSHTGLYIVLYVHSGV